MKRLFFLLYSVSICLGCTESSPEPQISEKTKFLTASSWIISAYEITDSRQPDYVVDEYKFITSCQKDDSYSFGPDGNWTYNENIKKCNFINTDPRSFSGTWSLSDNDSKLILSKWSANSGSWDIIELSATTLKISFVFKDKDTFGTEYNRKSIVTFTH